MKFFAFFCVLMLGTSAFAADISIYTLYRSSVVDPTMRIHIATFDVDADARYNYENCWIAADLFRKQRGVTVQYWCEPGRFHR